MIYVLRAIITLKMWIPSAPGIAGGAMRLSMACRTAGVNSRFHVSRTRFADCRVLSSPCIDAENVLIEKVV